MSYASEVLADAPALYWHLDESSGNQADSSGNAHPGFISFGGVTYSVPGAVGTAFGFVGNDIYTTPVTALGATFSVECWLNATSGSNKGAAFNLGSGWQVWFCNLFTNVEFQISGDTYVTDYPAADLLDGNWHHVVLTGDAANLTLYVDGSQVWTTGTRAHTTAGGTTWRLGKDGGGRAFTGTVDEVAIYPTTLSSGRVAAHFGAVTLPTYVAASVTSSRDARTLTATATQGITLAASATLSRDARSLSASAQPVMPAAASLVRAARTLTAERTLIKLATPWTVEKSRSLTRADRTLSAVPSVRPPVEPTPDLVLTPGQILTRET